MIFNANAERHQQCHLNDLPKYSDCKTLLPSSTLWNISHNTFYCLNWKLENISNYIYVSNFGLYRMNDLNAALRFLNPHLDLSEARRLMWDELMTRTHDIFRGSGPDVTRRFGYADIPGGRTDATTPSTEEQYPTGSPENAQQVGIRCLTTLNYPENMNDSGEAKTPCALNVDFKEYMHSQLEEGGFARDIVSMPKTSTRSQKTFTKSLPTLVKIVTDLKSPSWYLLTSL